MGARWCGNGCAVGEAEHSDAKPLAGFSVGPPAAAGGVAWRPVSGRAVASEAEAGGDVLRAARRHDWPSGTVNWWLHFLHQAVSPGCTAVLNRQPQRRPRALVSVERASAPLSLSWDGATPAAGATVLVRGAESCCG